MLTSKRDAAKYKGPAADLWSSAVILFVMLSGAYPFEDVRDPRNMKKTVEVHFHTRTTIASHTLHCKALPPLCHHLALLTVACRGSELTVVKLRR